MAYKKKYGTYKNKPKKPGRGKYAIALNFRGKTRYAHHTFRTKANAEAGVKIIKQVIKANKKRPFRNPRIVKI